MIIKFTGGSFCFLLKRLANEFVENSVCFIINKKKIYRVRKKFIFESRF